MPEISEYESVAHCGNRIQKCLDREDLKTTPNFARAVRRSVAGLLAMYFFAYTLWGVMMMLSATVGVVGIVSFVRTKQCFLYTPELICNGSNGNPDDMLIPYQSIPTMRTGIFFVGLLFAFEIFRANLYSFIFAIAYRKGQRLRAGLNWLVINKVLYLNSIYYCSWD